MLCTVLAMASALGAGCVSPASSATTCEMATMHLSDCVGAEVAPSSTCDPADAEAVLAESCGALATGALDQKSDRFSTRLAAIGCRLGLYYLCDHAVCEPSEDEPAHELSDVVPAGASACLETALEYEGCGACDYYLCREEATGCGSDGYLVDFGYRYCNAYRLVTEPHASPAGQAWLRRVRRCLIVELDAADTGDDCSSIADAGIASHPSCYAETGFCDLPLSDWVAVLNTIDPRDVSLREVLATAHTCLRDWLSPRR